MGEEYYGAAAYLHRIQSRPFAELATAKGRYRFHARRDRFRPAEVWLEGLWAPAGGSALHLPAVYRRLTDDVELALEAIRRHIAAGQPDDPDWEGADTEDEIGDEEEGQ